MGCIDTVDASERADQLEASTSPSGNPQAFDCRPRPGVGNSNIAWGWGFEPARIRMFSNLNMGEFKSKESAFASKQLRGKCLHRRMMLRGARQYPKAVTKANTRGFAN